MRRIWERLGLIDYFELTLKVEKAKFLKVLRRNVEAGPVGNFNDTMDKYYKTDKRYKGLVGDDRFRLKRVSTWNSWSGVLVKGECEQVKEELNLKMELNVIAPLNKILLSLFALPVFISVILILDDQAISIWPLAFFAVVITGALMYNLRKNIAEIKYELERDFHFMLKDD